MHDEDPDSPVDEWVRKAFAREDAELVADALNHVITCQLKKHKKAGCVREEHAPS